MTKESPYIAILDTTLRDGEQTQGVSFSAAEKVNLARSLLEQLRVDRIEVASARVSSGEAEAVAQIVDWAAQRGMAEQVEVLGFVDGGASIDWIRQAGGTVINLLSKGSRRHCEQQLRRTPAQHLDDVRADVARAREHGLAVNLYLEDWSNGYRDDPRYVYDLLEGLAGAGIGHFMLPDTLGVLTPEQVDAAFGDMLRRFPELAFDFHPHNDYGLATANVLAAARAGVRTLHCTVNCLGERAGNASLAEVTVALRDQLGYRVGLDETHLARVSELVEYFSGKRIADNAPIVGADVFTQTAGIHADGDQKGSLYHSRLTPERFARRRKYALGKLAGKASLVKNLEWLGIELNEDNQRKVLQRVIELGDSKRTITAEDLPFIIAEVLESKNYNHVELLNCSLTSSFELGSMAAIKVRLEKRIVTTSGTGNGGYDAFTAALSRALKKHGLELPPLLDFEVRIPKGGRTDALTECSITWQTSDGELRTRGVHANQVFAAIIATMRMLNIVMHRSLESPRGAVVESTPHGAS